MQGERPLDGPARAGGDDAGRGEGRRPAAEDLARLIQDVAAVLVAERLGAPGPFNDGQRAEVELGSELRRRGAACFWHGDRRRDRKSTRLNSSHVEISYAVFCLKKKNKK